MKPQARRAGLLTRELPDELLVYDLEEHRAHCLNRTAATVFRHADGTRTAAEIARLLTPEGADGEEVVADALALLGEAGLLQAGSVEASLTRRDVVRRVGLGAALLLPAVASIVAPTPAEAATCVKCCTGQPVGTGCHPAGPNCVGTCQANEQCSTGLDQCP
jgi:hypothetical protein